MPGPTDVVALHSAAVEPPADLMPEAAAEWRRVVNALRPVGAVPPVDVLRIYCDALVRYRAAALALARSSPLVRDQRGDLVRNPLASVVRDEASLLRSTARDLGIGDSRHTHPLEAWLIVSRLAESAERTSP